MRDYKNKLTRYLAALSMGVTMLTLPHAAMAATVLSIVPTASGPSSATTETFIITFDQAVTGVSTDDFTVDGSGTARGTILSVTGTGAQYTITVDGITGLGTLRISLNGGTNIRDGDLNGVPSYYAGQSLTIVAAPTPVPTLDEWAMILLGLGLSGLAAFKLVPTRRHA